MQLIFLFHGAFSNIFLVIIIYYSYIIASLIDQVISLALHYYIVIVSVIAEEL